MPASTLAQQQPATPAAPATAANPLDAVPDAMPYGPPISAAKAQAAIQATAAEATRRGWWINIAVTDSGGNLVAFLRMDGSQLGSIAISQH